MTLRDFNAAVSEQDGYLLQWNPREQKLNCKRIAESVWMRIVYASEFEYLSEAPAPVSRHRFF